jgi:hypothetical protein
MVESEKTVIASQQLVKHVSAETNYRDTGYGTKAYPWQQLLKRQSNTEAREGGDLCSVLQKL